ncbi:MAG: hypothetical protein RL657_1572 [Pseudomonadota bacterium]|jgi:hypothetical protein
MGYGCASGQMDLTLEASSMDMNDERCCGSGTCIINAEGFCWCGQRWDGQSMCFPDREAPTTSAPNEHEKARTDQALD